MTRLRGPLTVAAGACMLLGIVALAAAHHDQFPTRPASPATSPAVLSTVVGQPSGGSSPSGIPYAQARDLGLLREDAVSVSGPSEVTTGGRRTPVTVVVTLPTRPPDRRVEVDWSGSCTLSDRAATTLVDIPVGATQISATVVVAIPSSASSCYARADALFPGKPYTGAGVTVTLRP